MVASKGNRLVQRSNGVYYIVWPGNTRGVSTGTRDANLASAKFANFQSTPEVDLSCASFLREYEAEHVGGELVDPDGVRRPKVADPKGERIRIRHLTAHFGDIQVPDLTEQDVDEYVRKRVANGAPSPHTHHREMSLLLASINHHMKKPPRLRRLTHDEIPRFRLPSKGDPRTVWLELEEIDAFLLSCFHGEFATMADALADPAPLPRVFRFAMLGFETGARPGAILDLTWDRVQDGVIQYHIDGRRRTKKRRPTVPVSNALRPILDRARADDPQGTHPCGGIANVRTSWDSARRRAAARLLSAGNTVGAAKMMSDFTPHCMRHTFATQALRHGVGIWEVAGMLGDTVETVERTYGHHCPNYLKSAVNWRAPSV